MRITLIHPADWELYYVQATRDQTQEHYDKMKAFSKQIELSDAVTPVDKQWLRSLVQEFGRYPDTSGTPYKVAQLDRSDMIHVNAMQEIFHANT